MPIVKSPIIPRRPARQGPTLSKRYARIRRIDTGETSCRFWGRGRGEPSGPRRCRSGSAAPDVGSVAQAACRLLPPVIAPFDEQHPALGFQEDGRPPPGRRSSSRGRVINRLAEERLGFASQKFAHRCQLEAAAIHIGRGRRCACAGHPSAFKQTQFEVWISLTRI